MKIWTLLTQPGDCPGYFKRKRLPFTPSHPNILARSLARYGLRLHVLTDQAGEVAAAAKEGGVKNIEAHPIRPGMTTGLKFELPGWWWKLVFFNRDLFDGDGVLFLDLDGVCVNDPAPLFKVVRKARRPMIYTPIYNSPVSDKYIPNSAAFYLDHRTGWPHRVWKYFLDESLLPERNVAKYGKACAEFTPNMYLGHVHKMLRLPEGLVGLWPRKFCCHYDDMYQRDLVQGGHILPDKEIFSLGYPRSDVLFVNFFVVRLELILALRLPDWEFYAQFVRPGDMPPLQSIRDTPGRPAACPGAGPTPCCRPATAIRGQKGVQVPSGALNRLQGRRTPHQADRNSI